MSQQPNDTIDALRATARAATFLADHATDIHALAHERIVTERVGSATAASDEIDDYINTGIARPRSVGDGNAKRAWRDLADQSLRTEKDLRVIVAQFMVIMGGPSALPQTELFINRKERKEIFEARQRRIERGEYTPFRTEPQPGHPKGKGR